MLHFSRWKALAILLTSIAVCLFTVPSLLSQQHFLELPHFMQRRLVLGLDLQGGSHLLLEVDSAAVRTEKLQALRDDVRKTLREARIGYRNLSIQGNSVQLRAGKPEELPEALRRLRELSAPTGGLLAAAGGLRAPAAASWKDRPCGR
jgi:preprotein translocase subunit SecD